MLCVVSDVFGMWPLQQHLSVPKFRGIYPAGGCSALLSPGESTTCRLCWWSFGHKGFLLLAQGLDKRAEGTLNSPPIDFFLSMQYWFPSYVV